MMSQQLKEMYVSLLPPSGRHWILHTQAAYIIFLNDLSIHLKKNKQTNSNTMPAVEQVTHVTILYLNQHNLEYINTLFLCMPFSNCRNSAAAAMK